MKLCVAWMVVLLGAVQLTEATFWLFDILGQQRYADPNYEYQRAMANIRTIAMEKRRLQLLGLYPIVVSTDGMRSEDLSAMDYYDDTYDYDADAQLLGDYEFEREYDERMNAIWERASQLRMRTADRRKPLAKPKKMKEMYIAAKPETVSNSKGAYRVQGIGDVYLQSRPQQLEPSEVANRRFDMDSNTNNLVDAVTAEIPEQIKVEAEQDTKTLLTAMGIMAAISRLSTTTTTTTTAAPIDVPTTTTIAPLAASAPIIQNIINFMAPPTAVPSSPSVILEPSSSPAPTTITQTPNLEDTTTQLVILEDLLSQSTIAEDTQRQLDDNNNEHMQVDTHSSNLFEFPSDDDSSEEKPNSSEEDVLNSFAQLLSTDGNETTINEEITAEPPSINEISIFLNRPILEELTPTISTQSSIKQSTSALIANELQPNKDKDHVDAFFVNEPTQNATVNKPKQSGSTSQVPAGKIDLSQSAFAEEEDPNGPPSFFADFRKYQTTQAAWLQKSTDAENYMDETTSANLDMYDVQEKAENVENESAAIDFVPLSTVTNLEETTKPDSTTPTNIDETTELNLSSAVDEPTTTSDGRTSDLDIINVNDIDSESAQLDADEDAIVVNQVLAKINQYVSEAQAAQMAPTGENDALLTADLNETAPLVRTNDYDAVNFVRNQQQSSEIIVATTMSAPPIVTQTQIMLEDHTFEPQVKHQIDDISMQINAIMESAILDNSAAKNVVLDEPIIANISELIPSEMVSPASEMTSSSDSTSIAEAFTETPEPQLNISVKSMVESEPIVSTAAQSSSEPSTTPNALLVDTTEINSTPQYSDLPQNAASSPIVEQTSRKLDNHIVTGPALYRRSDVLVESDEYADYGDDAALYDELVHPTAKLKMISLIPVLIVQLRAGRVTKDEVDILQDTYGAEFWKLIMDEVESNSSFDEMTATVAEIMREQQLMDDEEVLEELSAPSVMVTSSRRRRRNKRSPTWRRINERRRQRLVLRRLELLAGEQERRRYDGDGGRLRVNIGMN